MLKGPSLKSSGLDILVFQDRPDRGVNMFKKFEKFFKHLILGKWATQITGLAFILNMSLYSNFWANLGLILVELILEHNLHPHLCKAQIN